MIEKIVKRDGRVVPFNKEKIAFAVLRAAVAVGGRNRRIAESIADDVVRLLETRQQPGTYPTVEEVQDLVEKVLIERGHARTAKAYIVYRYEHALKRAGKRSLTYSPENIPYAKLWEALSWTVDHGCVTLRQVAERVEAGRFAELVRDSEEYYRFELQNAADKILERVEELKLVIIAGPSSSGKTTTTLKIAEKLSARGYTLVPLNVDNYFYDLEVHPRDVSGDYDFETPQALDLELISRHLAVLLAGDAVQVPHYNFRTGRREGLKEEIRLGPKDILLIDSLHGLSPEMTGDVPEGKKFRLYIETLAQVKDRAGMFLRWADVRLLRRMVRDLLFRNYNPLQTIQHWHFVRRAELRYIIPRLREADVIVNSFLAYELPIMKRRVGEFFPGFIERFQDDPERTDAQERARRVHDFFQEIPAWSDESVVPGDSLLREFIGGSTLRY
jgi:uridine kinase